MILTILLKMHPSFKCTSKTKYTVTMKHGHQKGMFSRDELKYWLNYTATMLNININLWQCKGSTIHFKTQQVVTVWEIAVKGLTIHVRQLINFALHCVTVAEGRETIHTIWKLVLWRRLWQWRWISEHHSDRKKHVNTDKNYMKWCSTTLNLSSMKTTSK